MAGHDMEYSVDIGLNIGYHFVTIKGHSDSVFELKEKGACYLYAMAHNGLNSKNVKVVVY